MPESEMKKICYAELHQSFRSLNQHMWQIPMIAMTLTGGLWLGTEEASDAMKSALFLFGGIANICLIIVLQRTRYVMGQILIKLEELHPEGVIVDEGVTLP